MCIDNWFEMLLNRNSLNFRNTKGTRYSTHTFSTSISRSYGIDGHNSIVNLLIALIAVINNVVGINLQSMTGTPRDTGLTFLCPLIDTVLLFLKSCWLKFHIRNYTSDSPTASLFGNQQMMQAKLTDACDICGTFMGLGADQSFTVIIVSRWQKRGMKPLLYNEIV